MAHFKRGNLQLKTNQQIQLGDNQETFIEYDGSNLLMIPSTGSTELYYNGGKRFETTSKGVFVTDGTDIFGMEYTTAGSMWLQNYNHGGLIYLWGENNSGTGKIMLSADPDASVIIYHAGSATLTTQTGGFIFQNSADQAKMVLSTDIIMDNLVHGGRYLFRAEDTGGVQRIVSIMDPDGAAELYHAGNKALETISNGVLIYNPANAAHYGHIKMDSNFNIISYFAGGDIKITARNLASADKFVFWGDADGAAELYYAGVKTFETLASGIKVTCAVANDAIFIDQNGNGNSIDIDSEATSQHVINIASPKNTNSNILQILSADSLTTGRMVNCYSGSTSASTRDLMNIYNGSAAATGTTVIRATNASTGLVADFVGAGGIKAETLLIDTGEIKSTAGNIELYYAGDVKLATDSTGIIVTGTVTANDLVVDGDTITIGTGEIKSTAGNVELYNSGAKTFETITGGVSVGDGVGTFDSYVLGGHSYIVGNSAGGSVFIQGTSGGVKTMINMNPASSVKLYHAGISVFTTLSTGFYISSGSNAGWFSYQTNDLEVFNQTNSGKVLLAADNSGDTKKTLLSGDPDGAVELYYAGVKTFGTIADGVEVYGSTALEVSSLAYDLTDGFLYLRNTYHGGGLYLTAENNSGTERTLFSGDPDTNVKLYAQGINSFATQNDGITVGNGSSNAKIYYSGDDFIIENQTHSGHLKLWGENSVGTNNDLFVGDPDGAVELYYAGDKKFETTSGGAAVTGDLDVSGNITGAGGLQVISYTLPLTGVVDNQVPLTGTFVIKGTGATGDVATDFPISNQHGWILINSITLADSTGTITITGTSLSESTAVPVTSDTEEINVDATTGTYYQTDKKWWEIINIDVGADISAIDFDYGVLGYPDLGNRDFKILGYRFDAFAAGNSPDMRLIISKVDDLGGKKVTFVDLEDIGVDSGEAGNQIVDHVRAGGSDRSYDPDVADIWLNNETLTLKQLDFDTYWSGNENEIYASTENSGFFIRIEGEPDGTGITNVDFVDLLLYYSLL